MTITKKILIALLILVICTGISIGIVIAIARSATSDIHLNDHDDKVK